MQETAQQYTKRLLGYLGNKNPLRVMLETPKLLAQLVHGVPKRTLMTRRRVGKWSVGEILAHLSEAELVYGWRLRIMVSRNRILIQAMDQDAWARIGRYRKTDPDRALEMFTVLRENNLHYLKSLSRSEWNHYGMHEERGKETLKHFVSLTAGHDLNHTMQIQGMLRRRRG